MSHNKRNISTKIKLIPLFLTAAIIGVIGVTSGGFSSAASGTSTLSLSSNGNSYTTGGTVVVSIVLNAGSESINDVQGVLNYPSGLTYESSAPGPDFSASSAIGGSGSFTFDDSAPAQTTVSGTQTVATVTFKATGSGTAALSLSSVCPTGNYSLTCSAAYDSNTNNNDLAAGGVSGTSISVTAPVITPPPTPTPTPTPTPVPTPVKSPVPTPTPIPAAGGGSGGSGSTSKGSTSSGSTSTTSTSSGGNTSSPSTPSSSTVASVPASVAGAPALSDVKATNITASGAVISWQTDIPSTSVVSYGLTGSYGLGAQDDSLATSHSITLGNPFLAQGTNYYFMVSSASSSGATTSSGQLQFTTVGYSILLHIVDKHGKPIANAKITLDGVTSTTQSNGDATLQNVPAGNQSITIKSGSKTTKTSVKVGNTNGLNGGTSQRQSFSLTASRGVSYTWIYIAILILFVIALTPTLTKRLIYTVRSHRGGSDGPYNPPGLENPIFVPVHPQDTGVVPDDKAPQNSEHQHIDEATISQLARPTVPSPGSSINPEVSESGDSQNEKVI
jgi:hypothetical protein